jgi:hypothetical protein
MDGILTFICTIILSYILIICILFCILVAVGFMPNYGDPVYAAKTTEDLVSMIQDLSSPANLPKYFSKDYIADAALLYPTHRSIEIATRREPSRIPVEHPSDHNWIAALLTRDDKGEVLTLLLVEDKVLSSRERALRLLAQKVKEAVKEAEKKKLWAKLRDSEEYEWTVHSKKEEEEGFVVVEGKM